VLEPVVTVVVITEEAVVLASHPLHVVQGASLAQLALVQPLHVLAGQSLPPHQEVQGPAVQEPEDCEAQGPQPFAAPPKGPAPFPPCQPPGPRPPGPSEEFEPGPQAPKGAGAPVVWVCQLERAEA
jgi:hypothetical protein